MEASMSKRFESAKQSRMRFINHRNGPRTPQEAGQAAVREAERILSETEPASDAFPYVFTEGLTRMDALGVVTAHVSLAERLSAVLPVLDELAFEAGHPGNMPAFEPWAESIWRRNRATDASMAHA
jgi:hypothetical protein